MRDPELSASVFVGLAEPLVLSETLEFLIANEKHSPVHSCACIMNRVPSQGLLDSVLQSQKVVYNPVEQYLFDWANRYKIQFEEFMADVQKQFKAEFPLYTFPELGAVDHWAGKAQIHKMFKKVN